MRTSDGSNIKYAKRFFARTGTSTYKETVDAWAVINGTQRQIVPPNVIVMYDATQTEVGTYNCHIADGNSGTLNLLNKFPYVSNNGVSFSGTETHGGEDHGASSQVTTSAVALNKNTYNGASLGSYRNEIRVSTHTHEVKAHTHTGTGSNLPAYKNLVPTMYGDVIYPKAVFLHVSTITAQSWFEAVNYAKYIRYANSNGTSNGTAHTHGSITMDTETSTMGMNASPGTKSQTQYGNHYHGASHAMASVTVTPYAKNYLAYRTKELKYWDQLPSGTIALCISSLIPKGWSRYSPEASNIFTGGSGSGYYGSKTHTHGSKIVTVSGFYGDAGGYGVGSNSYSVSSHEGHTFTDIHKSTGDLVPPSVELYAIVKN